MRTAFTKQNDIVGGPVICDQTMMAIVDSTARGNERNFTNTISFSELAVIGRLGDLMLPKSKPQNRERYDDYIAEEVDPPPQ